MGDLSFEGEVWTSEGKSQDDFMLKDECILLDFEDNAGAPARSSNAAAVVAGTTRRRRGDV